MFQDSTGAGEALVNERWCAQAAASCASRRAHLQELGEHRFSLGDGSQETFFLLNAVKAKGLDVGAWSTCGGLDGDGAPDFEASPGARLPTPCSG